MVSSNVPNSMGEGMFYLPIRSDNDMVVALTYYLDIVKHSSCCRGTIAHCYNGLSYHIILYIQVIYLYTSTRGGLIPHNKARSIYNPTGTQQGTAGSHHRYNNIKFL